MTRVKEVLEFLKREKSKPRKKHRISGACTKANMVAEQFGGLYLYGEKAKGEKKQKYTGHGVAVIPIRRPGGIIIQYAPRKVLIGQVSNIGDHNHVKQVLASVTGDSSWQIIKDYSGKRKKR